MAGLLSASWFLLVVTTSTRHCQADDARISIRVLDEHGDLSPCRGWVDAAGRRLFQPDQPPTVTPYARDSSFSCDGTFVMTVPAGTAVVHIEKGKEYRPVDVALELKAEESIEKTVQIERWIDMPSTGWYSADLHVHLGYDDPRVLTQLALADDVHLVPSFTYWLRGRGESWHPRWPGAGFQTPLMIDPRHLVTRNNIEIERINRDADPGATIGATFLFNLKQPVTAAHYGEHFPTDAELCRLARQHSPGSVFDSDKPSWAETVIGAALGMLDTVQVCHNHYYRSSTGPGGYGMIGPLAVGESNAAVGDGLFHRTNSLYYRFLNCGFRLGVSGGSAIGVKAMPTGHHRVYAQIEGPITAEKMWQSIKAGRTFATTGPMLKLSVDDHGIGATISVDTGNPRPLTVRTSLQSIESVEALQIVQDGRLVASRKLIGERPQPVLQSELELKLSPRRSGWIASRVLYRAPDGLLRQAHTSPIYLTVDGRPTAAAPDARYMLRWIDRLVEVAHSEPERFPDDDSRNAVLATYTQAQSRYQQIIDQARQHWGD